MDFNTGNNGLPEGIPEGSHVFIITVNPFARACFIFGMLGLFFSTTGVLGVIFGSLGLFFGALSVRNGEKVPLRTFIGRWISGVALIVGLVVTVRVMIALPSLMQDQDFRKQFNYTYQYIYGEEPPEIYDFGDGLSE
ncbi:MAG: hypothetical protein K6D96_08060 [Acetatifactor sp.]|nr:hypothetical protein [Acetatifactor sp.]